MFALFLAVQEDGRPVEALRHIAPAPLKCRQAVAAYADELAERDRTDPTAD